ncbi:MAG: tyrosine-type recombinase/integrase [Candidatus Omnitrophica bacterium]|nr:tyrosine-type recombinase/integrase [Candidatus Omnitrophota bacterium]
MNPKKDIYGHDLQYTRAKEHLQKAEISQANKDLIFKFDEACSLERLSISRKTKIISYLIILARDYIKIDFDKATKDQLKQAVLKIDGREDYSVWTRHSYKTILKKFYRWHVFGDGYLERQEQPEIISWMRVSVSEKEKPRVNASDILTEREIDKLIEVAENPRDKAFVGMLYELGARIGEIGKISIGDISRDNYSFIIDLSGKTGHRTPRIVVSDSYLTTWLNSHPLKNDPSAPLWVMLGNRNKNQRMKYAAFRALVLRLKEKAKIKKRIYPHLFRHTRVTHLLINKQINESQAKVYFGWVPSSNMLSEYSHLVSRDVNDVMLEIHGFKKEETEKQEPKIKQCPRCNDINPKDHLFCKKCGSVLDVKTAIALDEKKGGFESILADLLRKDLSLQEALIGSALKEGLGKKLMELYFQKQNTP